MPLSERLRRHDPEAIALLVKRFEAPSSELEKKRAAVFLVALGQEGKYFDFLARAAQKAIESEMPFPLQLDERGDPIPKELSPEFVAWAEQAGQEPQQAARKAIYEQPGDLLLLGMTLDPRATDLLRRGLASPNPMVVYRSAEGLARVRAVDAVPEVVAAAEAAPGHFSQLMARALVLFEDPRAEAAAARLIPDPRTLEALRQQARAERKKIEQDLSELQR